MSNSIALVVVDRLANAQESTKTVADGVYTDAQAARGAAVYDAACAGVPSRGSRRRHRPGPEGRAIRPRIRRQGSEDAVHQDRDDDAAGRAGKPRRHGLSRHRRAPAERERVPGRVARAHGRRARRRPRAAGTAQSAAADRRFLLCRSGRLPERRRPEYLDADAGQRAGRGYGGRLRGACTGGIREATRHADVPAGRCDGLRARRSPGPEGEHPRSVDQSFPASSA